MTIHLAAGAPKSNPWGVLYDVLRDKPFMTVPLVIQLIGTSQMTAAIITVLRTSTSATFEINRTPNQWLTDESGHRVPLAVVVFLWRLSGIGVWQRRLCAWLNGLAATTTIILQFATAFFHLGKPNRFLLN
jgi:hypothetical protein